MSLFSDGTSVSLSLLGFFPWFFPSFFLGWVHHGLLCCSHLLLHRWTWRSYHVFVASGAGFFFIVWPLRGILGRVLLEYFEIFRRVLGAMRQACFPSGRTIARIAWISCLALSSAAFIRVGRKSSFSSISFLAMTGTVGICPNWSLRSCSTFVEFFRDYHSFEHITYSLVALKFRTSLKNLTQFVFAFGCAKECAHHLESFASLRTPKLTSLSTYFLNTD